MLDLIFLASLFVMYALLLWFAEIPDQSEKEVKRS